MRQVGVEHFLVPAAQGEEQIARARQIGGDDVEIIPVATLDEALAALERLGGDPAPRRRLPEPLPRSAATSRLRSPAMAISFSRPDPSSPAAVADAAFGTARRGFDQQEVRDFLRMVAAELARLQERERFLERELRAAQANALPADGMDDETATRLLGEEAARILQTAREGAAAIRNKAEDGAAQLLRDAAAEAQRVREEADLEASRRRTDAARDAESELGTAKQQGREMVDEARAYRERVPRRAVAAPRAGPRADRAVAARSRPPARRVRAGPPGRRRRRRRDHARSASPRSTSTSARRPDRCRSPGTAADIGDASAIDDLALIVEPVGAVAEPELVDAADLDRDPVVEHVEQSTASSVAMFDREDDPDPEPADPDGADDEIADVEARRGRDDVEVLDERRPDATVLAFPTPAEHAAPDAADDVLAADGEIERRRDGDDDRRDRRRRDRRRRRHGDRHRRPVRPAALHRP